MPAHNGIPEMPVVPKPGRPPSSHPKATLRLPQGHLKATSKPPDSQAIGTPKPPQGYPKAPPKPPQGHPKATSKPPSCDAQCATKAIWVKANLKVLRSFVEPEESRRLFTWGRVFCGCVNPYWILWQAKLLRLIIVLRELWSGCGVKTSRTPHSLRDNLVQVFEM